MPLELFEDALYSQLAETTEIAAIVGDRIYPVEVPELPKGKSAFPCVVYRLANRPDIYTLDGVADSVEDTVELTYLAGDYRTTKKLARAGRTRLNNIAADDPLAQFCPAQRGFGARKIAETEIKENDPLEQVDVFNVTQSWVIHHLED